MQCYFTSPKLKNDDYRISQRDRITFQQGRNDCQSRNHSNNHGDNLKIQFAVTSLGFITRLMLMTPVFMH